jgi:hypothetical protein
MAYALPFIFYLASSFHVEVLVLTFGKPNDKALKTEHSWQIYSLHQELIIFGLFPVF